MSTFSDLELGPAVLDALEAAGYRRPTAFQREAIPVIARGTHAVGVASAGSGKTLAWALGLAMRLEPDEPGLQALVLRPTDDAAARSAEAVVAVLRAVELSVAALRAGAPGAPATHIVVASPAAALAALERSALKLEGLKTVVVDGISSILGLGGGDDLETVIMQAPRAAQRVVLTADLTAEASDWLERHARRARRLVPPDAGQPMEGARAEYLAAPVAEWLPTLIAGLEAAESREILRSVIHCRREGEAEALADRLLARGLPLAAAAGEPGVHVLWGEEAAIEPGDFSVSWGAPPDLPSLRGRLTGAARALLLLEPRELPHIRRLAAELAVRLDAVRSAVIPEAARSLERTREHLRAAVNERDLEPYLLLLEPLLEEMGPARIAAAAVALLREREPGAPEPSLPAWTRLYFGVGRRDGVRPADIVGAITGEAPVRGEQVGRIEILDTHALVEVDATVAEQVIRALASTTIRGRPAKVRVYQ